MTEVVKIRLSLVIRFALSKPTVTTSLRWAGFLPYEEAQQKPVEVAPGKTELGLIVRDSKIVVSSRDVARVFEKEHKHVMESIRELDCPEEFARSNFRPGSYKDGNNQDRPEYLITRDGFTLLVDVLEIDDARKSVGYLDDDEKGTHIVSTPGGNQSMTVVTEAGLYSLILRVRIVMKDEEPWFIAADVCKVLELERTQDSVRYLDDDEKGMCLVNTPSGQQQMLAITESGLYSLVLRSRKQEAKAFKRWVIHDVLPSIRKHGAYLTPETIIDLAIWRVVECFSLGARKDLRQICRRSFLRARVRFCR